MTNNNDARIVTHTDWEPTECIHDYPMEIDCPHCWDFRELIARIGKLEQRIANLEKQS